MRPLVRGEQLLVTCGASMRPTVGGSADSPCRQWEAMPQAMLPHSRPPRRPAGFIEPCLPTLAREVPAGPLWVHEIQHDGYRFICRREGERVRVFSRHGRDWTHRMPAIVEAMLALPVASVTIDGEGVVCDERGLSDFDRLRSALAGRGSREAFLYAFDLLELDGQDLRGRPWDDRRVALVRLLRKSRGGLRLSEQLDGDDGATMFAHACHLGLEGIVAKRRDRPYCSGRCADWVKIKNPAAPVVTRVMERE
jgi:bifunctional non-homologous end joining protein LigD